MNAYNAEDGSIEWRTIMDGNASPSRPTIADGAIYHADTQGNFYAFDAKTGAEQWRFTADAEGYSVGSLTANGLVYFEIEDTVYAITRTDGNEVWRLKTPHFLDMATDGDIIYIGTGDSKLRAVDANSGSLLRKETLGNDPRTITVSNGVLYIGGSSYMAAFNTTDGSRLWRFDSGFVTTSAAVAQRLVYFGDNRNQFYAVDKDTGRERWRFTVGEARFDGINSSPAVVGNLVYFGSYDKHIYALNAHSGQERWSYNTGEEISGSPAVVNERVHIPTRLSGLITVASKSRPKNSSRR